MYSGNKVLQIAKRTFSKNIFQEHHIMRKRFVDSEVAQQQLVAGLRMWSTVGHEVSVLWFVIWNCNYSILVCYKFIAIVFANPEFIVPLWNFSVQDCESMCYILWFHTLSLLTFLCVFIIMEGYYPFIWSPLATAVMVSCTVYNPDN